MGQAAPVRLHLLGTPRAETTAGRATLRSRKALTLLGYLASAQDAVSRERLADLLWPDSSARSAHKNLRNELWKVQSALGHGVLDADSDWLRLRPTTWVDTRALEAAAGPQAVARAQSLCLYRGTFLDGVALGDAAEIDVWLAAERQRYFELYVCLAQASAECEASAGNWPRVAEIANHALAHDPLSEPLHRLLMQAYVHQDRRADALRQYGLLRDLLARELGLRPGPATEQLRRGLLQGAPLGTTNAPTDAHRGRLRSSAERAPFVGRDAERAALDAAFDDAVAGNRRVVLLSGEMGIGKSRLWREWLSNGALAEAVVLESRCLEATRGLPFVPIAQWLSSKVCLDRLFTRSSPVAEAWLVEVARLLPELRERLPDLPPLSPTVSDNQVQRRNTFEAYVRCLLAFQAQPLVLFMDDAQWADQASVEWLGYLMQRLDDAGHVLLALAYTAELEAPGLTQAARSWAHEGIAVRIALEGLSETHAQALLRGLGTPPQRSAEIRARAGGNPLFLIELARSELNAVPSDLAEVVAGSLSRLSASAGRLAEAAAVLEVDTDLTLLARTAAQDDGDALDGLEALLASHILRERDGRYGFAHPLIGEITRSRVSVARRRTLHGRAAEAYEALEGRPRPGIAARVARHYEQAGEPESAAAYAEQAAEWALALAASGEAAALFRQSLANEYSASRWLGLARALYQAGDVRPSQPAAQSALEASLAEGNDHVAVRACLHLAQTHIAAHEGAAAVRWVRRGLGYAGDQTDAWAQSMAHYLLGAGLRMQGDAPATPPSRFPPCRHDSASKSKPRAAR